MKKVYFTRKVIRTVVYTEHCVLDDTMIDMPDWVLPDTDPASKEQEYQEKLADLVWDENWCSEIRWDEWEDSLDAQCEELYDIEVYNEE